MLRSILVGIDGSADGDAAFELGLRWARQADASLVGIGVIDEPGIRGVDELLAGGAYFRKLDEELLAEARRQVEQSLRRCAPRCAEAGLAFRPLEEVGAPADRILLEAQRHDLIVLGRQTHFRYGYEDAPDDTLSRVLHHSPRPVVVAPRTLDGGEAVVIAYDGSVQAARAVASFRASGRGRGREVHVVCVAAEGAEAACCADRAVEYLRSHEISAHACPLGPSTAPAEAILAEARQRDAGLIVMGAYSQPALREFFLGSVTRALLNDNPLPVFLDH